VPTAARVAVLVNPAAAETKLFVALDVFLNSRRAQLVNLASRHAVPAAFSNRDFAEIGGLMSYGTDITATYRQLGAYAGRQDARPHRAALAARRRRRGDRVK
jgi:hypothetical protein